MTPTGTLDDLVPTVRGHFDALIAEATRRGLNPRIRSVGRTCADQNALSSGSTFARFCRSWHVLGRAVDFDVDGGCPAYTSLGEWWEARGGSWGGRFSGFGPCGDAGHFQWPDRPGALAVPLEICPEQVTLAECEQIRLDHYAANQKSSWIWVLVGSAAALGLGWHFGRNR